MNAQRVPSISGETTSTKTLILAVEDDLSREAIAAELSQGGYQVIQVEDGYELFDCLELFLRIAKPAVIVAECSLSGRSGFELCAALKSRPGAPKVILIAPFDDEEAWEHAETAGASFVLDNPVDVIELFDALDLSTDLAF